MIKAETLPKILVTNYQRFGGSRIHMRKKDLGIWNEYTWEDTYNIVKYFCLGLVSLGFKGGNVIIIGDTDPEWFLTEYAVQSAGGVPVGLYVDANASEVKHIVNHGDAEMMVVRDQEQIDKILELKNELPTVKRVIYWDKKGMAGYEYDFLLNYDEVIKQGKRYEQDHPNSFEALVDNCKIDDTAVICYTSGTSALPKGVQVTHKLLVDSVEDTKSRVPWRLGDDYVTILPPAGIGEQVWGITAALIAGTVINFPERADTAENDIREISPTIIGYGPRQWQSLISKAQVRVGDASWLTRFVYSLCMAVGYRVSDFYYAAEKPDIFWRTLYTICNLMIFRPLRDKLGLSKVRTALSGGSFAGVDVFRFFTAIGVPIMNSYALTEFPTVSSGGLPSKIDSLGVISPNSEVRISDDGEIVLTGRHLFSGYYKNPSATQEKICNGWFLTGDAGHVDDEGHVHYLDRVSDLITLAGGHKFSPSYIESRLKFSPYIRDVMVIGDETKGFVTAIVNINFETVGRWAEKNRINYTTLTDLSQKPEVCKLIGVEVNSINRNLPELARVRKFVNLYKEFDPDEAELTRTRKIRRKFMEERYGDLIKAIYSNEDKFNLIGEVKYQDGRVGKVNVLIRIISVLGNN